MNNEYGNWFLVVLSIAIFLYFIKTAFRPRTKIDWATYNGLCAFIVALFAEMYGFPLTIYLLTSYFGNQFLNLDLTHNGGHLLNTLLGIKGDPHFGVLHILSSILIVGGLFLLENSWKTLYKAHKAGRLATAGAYRYIRHPQYTAFVAIIVGFLLQWPTLITLLMAPILIWRYIRLSLAEEQAIQKKFGRNYSAYACAIPRFIPTFKSLWATEQKEGEWSTKVQ